MSAMLKFFRFATGKIGAQLGSKSADVSELVGSSNDFASVISAWKGLKPQLEKFVEEEGKENQSISFAAPILKPGKIICIGLNYIDHARECNLQLPSEPVVFSKFGNTICGPLTPIVKPKIVQKLDWEAELVCVVGSKLKNARTEQDAMDAVFGYMTGHDVSARDWQLGRTGGQWLQGKTMDGFAPIGPYLVPKDYIPDVHNLDVKLFVNDELMQNSNTKHLIFRVPKLMHHLSSIMTLEPGDLIFTGTPAGVGMGLTPERYLKAGDTVRVSIEHLGELENAVVDEES